MKSFLQSEPNTTQPQPPKNPKINPHLLKAISLMIITVISWLQPEAAILIFLVKLIFIFLDWLNQKGNSLEDTNSD